MQRSDLHSNKFPYPLVETSDSRLPSANPQNSSTHTTWYVRHGNSRARFHMQKIIIGIFFIIFSSFSHEYPLSAVCRSTRQSLSPPPLQLLCMQFVSLQRASMQLQRTDRGNLCIERAAAARRRVESGKSQHTTNFPLCNDFFSAPFSHAESAECSRTSLERSMNDGGGRECAICFHFHYSPASCVMSVSEKGGAKRVERIHVNTRRLLMSFSGAPTSTFIVCQCSE